MGDSAKEKELREQAAAEKKRADDNAALLEEERKRNARAADSASAGGILSFLGDHWGKLIFGGILLWFFGGTPQGKEAWSGIKDLFGRFIDWVADFLPDDWGAKLKAITGRDLTQILLNKSDTEVIDMLHEATGAGKDVLKTYIKSKEEKDALVKFLNEKNGGKLGQDDFTSANSIYALMTSEKYAPLLMDIAKASLAKAGKGEKLEGKPLEIVHSLRAIVASDKLDALLTTHRATTMQLLQGLAPSGMADGLASLIEKGVQQDKVTPALRTLLTKLLPDAQGKVPSDTSIKEAIVEYTKATPGAAIAAFQAFAKTEQGKTAAAIRDHNGGKAYQALVAHFNNDEEAVIRLLAELERTKGNKLTFMKTALENRAALDAYLAKSIIDKLPEDIQPAALQLKELPKEATAPVLRLLAKGIDPEPLKTLMVRREDKSIDTGHLVKHLLFNARMRQQLTEAGAEDILAIANAYHKNLAASVSPASLTALLKAAGEINASLPEYTDPEALKALPADKRAKARENNAVVTGTYQLIEALTDKLVNKRETSLNRLTVDHIRTFFANTARAEAARGLLNGLSETDKTPHIRAMLKHWDVISVLAKDEEGAEQVLANLKKTGNAPNPDSCKAPGLMDRINDIGRDMGLAYEKFRETSIGKNSEKIKALIADLRLADCHSLPQSAAPLPNVNGQGSSWGQTPFGFR